MICLEIEAETVRQSRALRDLSVAALGFWWDRYQAYRDFGITRQEITPAMDAELHRREILRRRAFGRPS